MGEGVWGEVKEGARKKWNMVTISAPGPHNLVNEKAFHI